MIREFSLSCGISGVWGTGLDWKGKGVEGVSGHRGVGGVS